MQSVELELVNWPHSPLAFRFRQNAHKCLWGAYSTQGPLGLQAPDRDDQEQARTSGSMEGRGLPKAQPTGESTEASLVPQEGLASPHAHTSEL